MKKTIVCFGDSNTHGYFAETGARFEENERWTGILADLLGDGYRIIEEGLSGRTTVFEDPLTEGLCGLSYITPCLMSHEPVDLLIIMLGTNDTKERFSVNAYCIAEGLRRLVKKAKTVPAWRNGEPNILIMSPVPIDGRYRTAACGDHMGDGCSEKSQGLASFYASVALDEGCRFLDAGASAGVSPHDYMHIDKMGHAKLASDLAKFIRGVEEL